MAFGVLTTNTFDEAVARALEEAAGYAHSYKILGSFPRASEASALAHGNRRSS